MAYTHTQPGFTKMGTKCFGKSGWLNRYHARAPCPSWKGQCLVPADEKEII